MIATLIFSAFCAIAAGMAFLHRPGSQAGLSDPARHWAWLLPALVAAILWTGGGEDYGRRLTLSVEELRIPLSEARADGVWFVVGPRAQGSDLVVGPYQDQRQSEEAYRVEFEGLLTVEKIDNQWQVCGHSVAPASDANLPGMAMSFGGKQLAQRTCEPITQTPLTALIERLDAKEAQAGRRGLLTAIKEWLFGKPAELKYSKTERRSLHISQTGEAITIRLNSDEMLTRHWGRCSDASADGEEASADDQSTNQPGSAESLRLAPAGLHQRDQGYRIPKNLVFSQLGQGGASPLLDPMRLGLVGNIAKLCAGSTQAIAWPAVGAEARLVGTGRTTSVSWWIAGLVLLSTTFTVLACAPGWRDGRGRVEAVVVITLQWLLALRLLIAMAGLANDPALLQAGILWPPAAAFICTPLIAVALLRGHAPGIGRAVALLSASVPLAGLLVIYELGWQWPGKQEILLGCIALTLLAARILVKSPQPLMVGAMYFASNATGRIALLAANILAAGLRKIRPLREKKQLRRFLARWRHIARRLMHTGAMPDGQRGERPIGVDLLQVAFLLAGLTLVGRILLALVNVKERVTGIPGLGNLPLSLIYAPLTIIVMALLVTTYRQRRDLRTALWLVVLFGSMFWLVAIAVGDLGLIFIYAWPVGWVIAGLSVLRPKEDGWMRRWFTRALLIGPLLSPVLVTAVYFAAFARDVPPPADGLSAHLEASSQWNGNLARLQRFVGADKLIDIGNSYSLGMLEQAAQLEPLTGDFGGHGYMSRSGVEMPLLGYQYSDNLLAVHIAWPFGRVGLCALLLGLLAMLGWLRFGPEAQRRDSWVSEASRLAALTIFWSGAYMALANLNLVPFTGRNFYLLSARSMGDLAEGLVLVLLAALPCAVLRREAPAKQSGSAQR